MQSESGQKEGTSEALPPPERPTAAGRVLIKTRMDALIISFSAQQIMVLLAYLPIGSPNYIRKKRNAAPNLSLA